MGQKCVKTPLDLWVYQEIIHEIQPDLIIETGTHQGGSAFYLATILDLTAQAHARVISIDVNPVQDEYPDHKRITYFGGMSSVDPAIPVERMAENAKTVMVILDSDHSQAHVSAEIARFAPLVTKGSYLIVEDTAVNGHPILPEHGPGPMEAVNEFLEDNREFVVDVGREKFLMTMNPRGYLKRVKE